MPGHRIGIPAPENRLFHATISGLRHSCPAALLTTAVVLHLVACAPTQLRWPAQSTIELSAVPFFPQARYQCGPAALATVLVHSGVITDPDDLVDDVYLPDRRGSLQLELVAATRRHERIPFRVGGDGAALLRELDAGHPVLVLQNLGVAALPIWHYAVVVGYDAERDKLILRSGTEARLEQRASRFLASWQRADYWGLVVPPASNLPAATDAVTVVEELLRSAPFVSPATTSAAWAAAVTRWPNEAVVLFGAANHSRLNGDTQLAATHYRRLLALHPEHVPGQNNFADLLLIEGCIAGARRVIEATTESLGLAHAFSAVVDQTRREIEAASVHWSREKASPCAFIES